MKKTLAALALIIAGSAFAAAESIINITIPWNTGMHFQTEEKTKSDGSHDTYSSFSMPITLGITGEYLYRFNNTPVALGAKIGGEAGKSIVIAEAASSATYYGNAYGWTAAPAIGFVFGDTTKKQITIYPFMYTRYLFNDVKNSDDNNNYKDFTLELIKSGVCFSWQWGERTLNGLEIGFNFDWASFLRYDDNKVIDKSGLGCEFHIAYKLSIRA